MGARVAQPAFERHQMKLVERIVRAVPGNFGWLIRRRGGKPLKGGENHVLTAARRRQGFEAIVWGPKLLTQTLPNLSSESSTPAGFEAMAQGPFPLLQGFPMHGQPKGWGRVTGLSADVARSGSIPASSLCLRRARMTPR